MISLIRALYRRQIYVLFNSDTSFTEQMMAAVYIGWGYILLWVMPDLISTNPNYGAMGIFAQQWFWGGWFLITGLLKLLGSALYGVLDKPSSIKIIRSFGAIMGTFIWSFIAIMFSRGSSAITGAVVYSVFASSCVLTMYRYVSWGWLGRLIARLSKKGGTA